MSDITRRRGDTYADPVQVTSQATKSPVNVTGYTFVLTVDLKQSPTTSANNLFVLTGVITDAANGIVEFAPTAAQTDRIGKFYYDIQMTDSAGRLRTIDSGKYTFQQDISK